MNQPTYGTDPNYSLENIEAEIRYQSRIARENYLSNPQPEAAITASTLAEAKYRASNQGIDFHITDRNFRIIEDTLRENIVWKEIKDRYGEIIKVNGPYEAFKEAAHSAGADNMRDLTVDPKKFVGEKAGKAIWKEFYNASSDFHEVDSLLKDFGPLMPKEDVQGFRDKLDQSTWGATNPKTHLPIHPSISVPAIIPRIGNYTPVKQELVAYLIDNFGFKKGITKSDTPSNAKIDDQFFRLLELARSNEDIADMLHSKPMQSITHGAKVRDPARGDQGTWESRNRPSANIVNAEEDFDKKKDSAIKKIKKALLQNEKQKDNAHCADLIAKEYEDLKNIQTKQDAMEALRILKALGPGMDGFKNGLLRIGVPSEVIASLNFADSATQQILEHIISPEKLTGPMLAFNLTGAFANLLSSFMGGKSTHQQVMEALKDLKAELQSVEKRLMTRLDGMESNLKNEIRDQFAIFKDFVANEMTNLNNKIRDVSQDVRDLHEEEKQIHRDIAKLQNDWFKTMQFEQLQADKDLYNDALAKLESKFDLDTAQKEIIKGQLIKLSDCAMYSNSSKVTKHLSPEELEGLINTKLVNDGSFQKMLLARIDAKDPNAFYASLPMLDEIVRALSPSSRKITDVATSKLPNIQNWGLCADAYFRMASDPRIRDWYVHSYLKERYEGELQAVMKPGQKMHEFLHGLKVSNPDVQKQVSSFEKALHSIEDAMKANLEDLKKRATEEAKIATTHQIDPFRGVAQTKEIRVFDPDQTRLEMCDGMEQIHNAGIFPPTPGVFERAGDEFNGMRKYLLEKPLVQAKLLGAFEKLIPFYAKIEKGLSTEGSIKVCVDKVGYTDVITKPYCGVWTENGGSRLHFNRHVAAFGKLKVEIKVQVRSQGAKGELLHLPITLDGAEEGRERIWTKVDKAIFGAGNGGWDLHDRTYRPKNPATKPEEDPDLMAICVEGASRIPWNDIPYHYNRGHVGEETATRQLHEVFNKRWPDIQTKLQSQLADRAPAFDLRKDLREAFDPDVSPALADSRDTISDVLRRKMDNILPSIYRFMPVEDYRDAYKTERYLEREIERAEKKARDEAKDEAEGALKAKTVRQEILATQTDRRDKLKTDRETLGSKNKEEVSAYVTKKREEISKILSVTLEEALKSQKDLSDNSRTELKAAFEKEIHTEMDRGLFHKFTEEKMREKLIPLEEKAMEVKQVSEKASIDRIIGNEKGSKDLGYSNIEDSLAGLEALVKTMAKVAHGQTAPETPQERNFVTLFRTKGLARDPEALEALSNVSIPRSLSETLRMGEQELNFDFTRVLNKPIYDPVNPNYSQIGFLSLKIKDLSDRIAKLGKLPDSYHYELLSAPYDRGDAFQKAVAQYRSTGKW